MPTIVSYNNNTLRLALNMFSKPLYFEIILGYVSYLAYKILNNYSVTVIVKNILNYI